MTLTESDIRAHLAFADRLADAARAAILPHFRKPATEVINKSERAFDPVTIADRGAEEAMRALVFAELPDHGVQGEEFGVTESRSGFSWVFDPIDGTRAFIAGLPTWGTLIALCFEGRPLIGVLDQGHLEERYRGWPGGANATLRGVTAPLKTRECPKLTGAILATTDPHLFTGAELGGFDQVRATAKLTRFGYDCYAYAMVAAGHMDMVVESGLKHHDVAALFPIVEGAGGIMTNWRGQPAWAGGQVIAAGDARAHEAALLPLRRAAG
jgi:histidinol phosphatase-like enzyme (inositol monophosphatase family)